MSGQEKYALGIDVGTTSVKVVFVNTQNGWIENSATAETKADLDVGDSSKSEQSVTKIFDVLNELMNKFPVELKRRVTYIGVSGQMHGVVLWKTKHGIWNDEECFSTDEKQVSSLITWQDQRCSPEFLSTLPEPGSQKLHTGFGIATMIWLQQNEPDFLKQYAHCGTVQDLLVDILIQKNEDTVLMTDQNAASWGYYDVTERNWNLEMLHRVHFPVSILPEVKPAGAVAGKSKCVWSGIPAECVVGLAVGDSQASVLSVLYGKESDGSALFNLSTSVQLTLVMPVGCKPPNAAEPDSIAVDYRPYFHNRFIAVGAGLNGGNCMAFFVSTLKSWTQVLGHQVSEEKIWEVLLQEGANQESSDLIIEPTLRGERHIPTKMASVLHLGPANFTLGHIMRSLCAGIVRNVNGLLPQEILRKYDVKRIYATGSALLKNRIIQEELIHCFEDFSVEMCDAGDSAYGAAVLGLTVV